MRHIVAAAPANRPLPTTRELGAEFDVANTTVFRLLRTMAEAGEIWQHPTNGRYYQSAARALLERPKPVACLIRRLELGSELYRELLEGVSAGCGEQRRTMLLWHDELLVNHPDPHEPPRFAPEAQQRAILQEFTDRHGAAAEGFVLDHIWSDEALLAHADRLQPAVVLFRSCPLKGFSNVAANFHAGALKALAHLLGRGFEQIIPVEPFAGDLAVTQFGSALAAAATELGCRDRLAAVASVGTDTQRTALVNRLQRGTRRTALLCPEDNIAALLLGELRAAKIPCPGRIGVLSVMGTDFATKAGLSCVRYDFRALGRLAVAALGGKQPVRHLLEPQFVSGHTT
jgi:DNA-binding LacI/PurR family transcriptional regulator